MNPDIHSNKLEQFNKDARFLKHIKYLCAFTVINSIGLYFSNLGPLDNLIYSRLCLMVGGFYFIMFLLLHFNLKSLYKVYFSFAMPLWALIVELYVGDYNFGHGIVSVGFGVTIYLFFQGNNLIRNLLLGYTTIMYIGSSLYTHNYGSIIQFNNPYDEFVVFATCLIWVVIIFSYYEHRMESFIQALTINNKELMQNKDELERFNYLASHDLKTPLRTISSFLGLINRDIEKNQFEDIREYSAFANSGVQQMQELIDGIVEISRIKTDFDEKNLELIDLNMILKRVNRGLNGKFEHKEFKVKSEVLPVVKGISTDFEIIMEEIIENGIRYNNSSIPEVRISSTSSKREFAIVFEDNGIGIAKPFHEQIFHFFKRLHSVADYPGTGLGLGLCRKIVNKYDGHIDVHSEFGVSSTFTVRIPGKNYMGIPKTKQLELAFKNN